MQYQLEHLHRSNYYLVKGIWLPDRIWNADTREQGLKIYQKDNPDIIYRLRVLDHAK